MSNKLKNQSASWRTNIKIIFFVALFVFLIINIVFSQSISSVYSQLINEDKNAAVSFLTKIKSLPVFKSELTKYERLYGKNISTEVFKEEREQKLMINKLEQILEKNPWARDVLYSLFLIYDQMGDQRRAQKYLQQTKEVDPIISH